MFVWQGERGESEECGALFKTHGTLLDRAVALEGQVHHRRLAGAEGPRDGEVDRLGGGGDGEGADSAVVDANSTDDAPVVKYVIGKASFNR